MATEVLVNDGGAPARILPFTAGSAVTAGRLVTMAGTGKVGHSGVNAHNAIGVALTDAAADGDIMSVVTGKALSGTSYAVCLELGTGTGVRMVKCLMRN